MSNLSKPENTKAVEDFSDSKSKILITPGSVLNKQTQEMSLKFKLFVSSNNWKYLQPDNRFGRFTHFLPDKINNINKLALESISTNGNWFNLLKNEPVEIWLTFDGRVYYKKFVFDIEKGYYRKISDLVAYINLKIEESFEILRHSDKSTQRYFIPTLRYNNNRVSYYYGRSLKGEFSLILLSEKLRNIFKLPDECSTPSGMYNFVGMIKSTEVLVDVVPYDYNYLILKSTFSEEEIHRLNRPISNNTQSIFITRKYVHVYSSLMKSKLTFFFENERGEDVDNNDGLTLLKFDLAKSIKEKEETLLADEDGGLKRSRFS